MIAEYFVSGIAISQLNPCDLPLSILKSKVAPDLRRSEVISCMVMASQICRFAFPFMFALLRLDTLAEKESRSPSRTNRGAFGNTIKSFCVCTNRSSYPVIKSFVWAKVINLHFVNASLMVNDNITFPSASVFSSGKKKTVSLRFFLGWTSMASGFLSNSFSELFVTATPSITLP